MQFMLILNETAEDFAQRNHPEQAQAYWGGWNAFIGAMAQAGVIVKGDGLIGPHSATTLRLRDGKRIVQDGPFAETKEALNGYLFFEADSLPAAVELASRIPAARMGGAVEVRPVIEQQW